MDEIYWDNLLKKSDRIESNFINSKLFKGKYIFGMYPSYVLRHPLTFLKKMKNEIYWAYQRVRYGCDYRVGWDLSDYIVEMMPRWIDLVEKSRCGISIDYYEGFTPNPKNGAYTNEEDEIASQRFTETLEKIKFAFQTAKEMNDNYSGKEKYEEQMKIFNEGFDLFRKYFWTLGD